MESDRKRFGGQEISLSIAILLAACFVSLVGPAHAQDATPHDVGVVYYADGSGFQILAKEIAPQSGRYNYSAKVKGAHAAVRLRAGQLQRFRMCGVDPSRYKLYTFKSTRNFRSVNIAKVNVLIGGARSTVSESEVPVSIQAADGQCFAITPKETLQDGEYGFSPAGAEVVFMFGVGDIKPTK